MKHYWVIYDSIKGYYKYGNLAENPVYAKDPHWSRIWENRENCRQFKKENKLTGQIVRVEVEK